MDSTRRGYKILYAIFYEKLISPQQTTKKIICKTLLMKQSLNQKNVQKKDTLPTHHKTMYTIIASDFLYCSKHLKQISSVAARYKNIFPPCMHEENLTLCNYLRLTKFKFYLTVYAAYKGYF